MKIVKPEVELIAVSMPIEWNWVGEFYTPKNWGDIEGEPERLIEQAGRVCYKSEDKIGLDTHKAFVEKVCNQMGHESIMEHASVTFRVVTDRGVSHEAVRHRIASYSQESTRYCNYVKGKFGGEIKVIEPPGLTWRSRIAWTWAMKAAERAYRVMIKCGCSPQIARSVLPTCLKTEFYWTANLREWKTILEQRTSPKAHPQMREIALMIQTELAKISPTLFDDPYDFEITTWEDNNG